MRASDAEYLFKRAVSDLERVKTDVERLGDLIMPDRREALEKDLRMALTHMSLAHTDWERKIMSHRQFSSEFDL